MPNLSCDRRVRKTKLALRNALAKLMIEKRIQSITVKELCERCDINRGTFYLHYTDVPDLLYKIEAELLVQMEELLHGFSLLEITPEKQNPVLFVIFSYLAENADICRVLLSENGDIAFVEKVKNVVRLKFMDEWSQRFPMSKNDKSDFIYTFIVSGSIGVLQKWLVEPSSHTPAAMAELIEAIVVKGVIALTEK